MNSLPNVRTVEHNVEGFRSCTAKIFLDEQVGDVGSENVSGERGEPDRFDDLAASFFHVEEAIYRA